MVKKNSIKFTLLIIAILTFHCELAFCQDEIIIVGNHAPPFRIIEDEKFTGIYFDIAKELFARLGMKASFKEQPFKRSLLSMESGYADIMMGPNKTAERETYMKYVESVKLSRANKAFYVHPDSTPISNYEDLHGKSMCVRRGNVYFDNDKSLNKSVFNSYEKCIKLIMLKRIDVVIIPELEGDYLTRKLKQPLTKSPYIIEGKESYLAISNESSLINSQKEIEQAFIQMKNDGALEKIFNEYK